MKFPKVLLALLLSVAGPAVLGTAAKDKIETLIESDGYEGKALEAETQDGYLLTVHYIRRKMEPQIPLRPVFLMHGMFANSGNYLLLGPNKALAYFLADNGFDVYLGNARGNSFSMKHKTLSTDSKEFWNFSWHEIGLYDLPAMFELVLNRSRSESLFYMGHSMGTTTLLVLLSLRPEYNRKINQAHLMAPAVFFKNHESFFLPLLRNLPDVPKYLRPEKSSYVTIPNTKFAENFVESFCQDSSISSPACDFMIYRFTNIDKDDTEVDLPVLKRGLLHATWTVSQKQIDHFGQLIKSGEFRMFDYHEDNIQVYNTSKPPLYELENVKLPVYLYSADRDALVPEKDVDDLQKLLQNVKARKRIRNYQHPDFVVGRNARKEIYDGMLQILLDHDEN